MECCRWMISAWPRKTGFIDHQNWTVQLCSRVRCTTGKKYQSDICWFSFVKSIPLFKMHTNINKNGRPSFASPYGNAISSHWSKTSTFATLTDLFIYSQFTKAWGILNRQTDLLLPTVPKLYSYGLTLIGYDYNSDKKIIKKTAEWPWP